MMLILKMFLQAHELLTTNPEALQAFGAWALLPLFNPDSANDARSGGLGLHHNAKP